MAYTFSKDLIFVSICITDATEGEEEKIKVENFLSLPTNINLQIWDLIKLKEDKSNEIHINVYHKLKTSDTHKILESCEKERVPCRVE